MRALAVIAVSSTLVACPAPGWQTHTLHIVARDDGRAEVYLGQAFVNNMPTDFRQRRGQIPLAGKASSGEPSLGDAPLVTLGFDGRRGARRAQSGFSGVQLYQADGTSKLVSVADGVTLDVAASKLLRSEQQNAFSLRRLGPNTHELLLHHKYQQRVWRYMIRGGEVISAEAIDLPKELHVGQHSYFDPWSSSPLALVKQGDAYVTAKLSCTAGACTWSADDRKLTLGHEPWSGCLRSSSGVPVVVGGCPESTCKDKPLALVHPGGVVWLQPSLAVVDARAISKGRLLILAEDFSDTEGRRHTLFVVDDQTWKVAAHQLVLAGRYRQLMVMDESTKGEVVHVFSLDQSSLELQHDRLELDRGTWTQITHDLDTLLGPPNR